MMIIIFCTYKNDVNTIFNFENKILRRIDIHHNANARGSSSHIFLLNAYSVFLFPLQYVIGHTCRSNLPSEMLGNFLTHELRETYPHATGTRTRCGRVKHTCTVTQTLEFIYHVQFFNHISLQKRNSRTSHLLSNLLLHAYTYIHTTALNTCFY